MAEYIKKVEAEFEEAWQAALAGVTTDGVDDKAIDRMLKASDKLSETVHKYGHMA